MWGRTQNSKLASETVSVTCVWRCRGPLAERATEEEQKERLHWSQPTIWMPGILMTKYFYWSVYEGMMQSLSARLPTSALLAARYISARTSRLLTVTLTRLIVLRSPHGFSRKRDCSQSTLLYVTLPYHTLLYPSLTIFHLLHLIMLYPVLGTSI